MTAATLNPSDMTPLEYLSQTDVWFDIRSGEFENINSMTEARRGYAARWLKRNSVAFIILIELLEANRGNLAGTLALVDQNPQTWMSSTPLYGAIERDERTDLLVKVDRSNIRS
jgi:hypothetical protein